MRERREHAIYKLHQAISIDNMPHLLRNIKRYAKEARLECSNITDVDDAISVYEAAIPTLEKLDAQLTEAFQAIDNFIATWEGMDGDYEIPR